MPYGIDVLNFKGSGLDSQGADVANAALQLVVRQSLIGVQHKLHILNH
jgi:hypothetical protein